MQANLSKTECVRRARNLNQQAISYRQTGKKQWAKELFQKRDQYMKAARQGASASAPA